MTATAPSTLLKSVLSNDGSLAAIVAPSSSGSSRILVQVYQVSDNSTCSLQLTLTHTTSSKLRDLCFVENSTIVGRFGTSEVVIWDLSRGVIANKLLAGDDQSFLGLAVTGDSSSTFYLLTRHAQKLYVHEYSAANFKLSRKIKSGRFEGGEDQADNNDDDETAIDSAVGLVVSPTHVVVRTSAGMIRVMDQASGKKVGKIKNSSKGGGAFISTMVVQGNTLAVLQQSGAAALYNLDTCKSVVRIPHHGASSSSVLQLDSSSDKDTSSTTLLVDHTVYSIQGSAQEKVTQLATSQPAALFLTKHNTVLALMHQKTKGAAGSRVRWVNLDAAPLAVDLDKEATPEETAEGTSATSKRKTTDPIMLGPGQAGTETAPPTKKIKADETTTETSKTEEETAKELSIAERLQQLTEALDEDEQEDDDEAMDTTPAASFKPKQATTESLKELLSQALQSGDDALLELALGVRDARVISTTLKEIEPSLILVLLSKVTTRLASNPLRAESLALWLSHCLKVGRFQPHHLASLRNLLYERIESFSDLLRLEGRLSMMCDVE